MLKRQSSSILYISRRGNRARKSQITTVPLWSFKAIRCEKYRSRATETYLAAIQLGGKHNTFQPFIFNSLSSWIPPGCTKLLFIDSRLTAKLKYSSGIKTKYKVCKKEYMITGSGMTSICFLSHEMANENSAVKQIRPRRQYGVYF